MYYTSKALRGAEERYPPIEKMALVLVTTARKLKLYYQAYTIIILTNRPLKKAINSPNITRRMDLWAIEMSEVDVQYWPRIAITAQALADFIVEFTPTEDKEGTEWKATPWVVITVSLSNKYTVGVGVLLKSLEDNVIECVVRLEFQTTNNEAEYKALLVGLNLARATRSSFIVISCDSQVITRQVNGDYKTKEST